MRQPPTIVAAGWRVLVVGSKLVRLPPTTTFHDFLFQHMRQVLGREWLHHELGKAPAARHPIAEWAEAGRHLIAERTNDPHEVVEVVPNGLLKAYLTLAYDLYVVADNEQLLKQVIKRLKQPASFQGARYELAVTATMLRAGFAITHEDERDPSRRHPEFVATHRVTGEVLAVEAKSKHRAGSLGFAGPAPPLEELKLGIASLLKNAIGKADDLPYVVFIDLNVPPETSYTRDITEWSDEISGLLRRTVVECADGVDRSVINLLLLTNFPDHYVSEAGALPERVIHKARSVNPKNQLRNPGILDQIIEATRLYGNVPDDWPSA